MRHLLEYMQTWKYTDSSRQLEVRRLKHLLGRRHRDDLRKEIRTPRSTGGTMPSRTIEQLACRFQSWPNVSKTESFSARDT